MAYSLRLGDAPVLPTGDGPARRRGLQDDAPVVLALEVGQGVQWQRDNLLGPVVAREDVLDGQGSQVVPDAQPVGSVGAEASGGTGPLWAMPSEWRRKTAHRRRAWRRVIVIMVGASFSSVIGDRTGAERDGRGDRHAVRAGSVGQGRSGRPLTPTDAATWTSWMSKMKLVSQSEHWAGGHEPSGSWPG